METTCNRASYSSFRRCKPASKRSLSLAANTPPFRVWVSRTDGLQLAVPGKEALSSILQKKGVAVRWFCSVVAAHTVLPHLCTVSSRKYTSKKQTRSIQEVHDSDFFCAEHCDKKTGYFSVEGVAQHKSKISSVVNDFNGK
eukprot:m.283067 g.283067  ORF g.283067 m.283067 type:complete len:141 (+) comp40669_c0_seq2:1048-1470(+)